MFPKDKPYIQDSFLSTSEDIIERVVLVYEVRLEDALRKNQNNTRIGLLFDVCNILWLALSLKSRGKLTRNRDKKLISSYTRKLSKL